MTEQEIERCLKRLSMGKTSDVQNFSYADVLAYIDRLKAENAELRKRLEKAVELPSGDRVWFITEDEEGEESYVISKPTGCLTVDELYEIGKKYFTTCEAAKKAVEELKRRDKNG